MKSSMLLVVACCLVGSWAAPLESTSPIPILKSSGNGPNPDGSYQWSYETGNGIKAEELGETKPGPTPDESITSVRGSYSYSANDGTPVQISYTADENGFQPKGAVIPQPPKIPQAILRALDWIASHPEEDNL